MAYVGGRGWALATSYGTHGLASGDTPREVVEALPA